MFKTPAIRPPLRAVGRRPSARIPVTRVSSKERPSIRREEAITLDPDDGLLIKRRGTKSLWRQRGLVGAWYGHSALVA